MKLILICLIVCLVRTREPKKEKDKDKVFFFNKCTYLRPNPVDCTFTLSSHQFIWDTGSCQQRMAGTENSGFAYLSLAVDKKVCCSDGKEFTVAKV